MNAVIEIREKGGRFLKRDEKSGLWFEIGDHMAREKVSQALRQRAPEMRAILIESELEVARQADRQAERQCLQQQYAAASALTSSGVSHHPNHRPMVSATHHATMGGNLPLLQAYANIGRSVDPAAYMRGTVAMSSMNAFSASNPQAQQNLVDYVSLLRRDHFNRGSNPYGP